ncbi:MAG: hypothetical protein Q8K82_06690 [Gemmatimonadaceae bacterium]|nr:hypothetical protein [Gemmatimonadaceae bacterium]
MTINSVTGDVTRNEEYYALAHASPFVRAGGRRIASTWGIEGLESVAFRNADDGSKVFLVVNVAGAHHRICTRSPRLWRRVHRPRAACHASSAPNPPEH